MYNVDNMKEINTMIDILRNQICVPVVPSMKRLEKFIESDLIVCILQDIHISLLEHMIKMLHENNKLALVHIDMVHGISSDEHGAEFLCQRLRADGVISSKTRIIETTKKNKKIAIQRMFLIDSKSIERGIETVQKSQPDIVEVMPAIAYKIIPYIKSKISMPLIGGGLLKSKEDILQGLEAGCMAFTVSDLCLCESMHE
ncbi:MAG: glycerol-3-phosphate responsive antiterminator [Erysipelothrix sp.]|jgi:glycerol uptake operon antiterminator|nr:glycerol-3-phosphate responsive antiterminator [Erysipelothrix sp.]